MSEISLKDVEELRKLVEWKKEKPDEYKQFLNDMKDVMLDLMKVSLELAKELDKTIE